MMSGSNKGAMLFSFSVLVVCILTIVGGGSFSQHLLMPFFQ